MRKYGVAHQAYAPLGQGHATELLSVGEVRDIASAHGKTSAQILLRFLVQSGISVIPKSAHTDRIVENGGIFDFELTASEMAVLAALDKAAPTIGDAENPEKTELAMTW